MLRLRLQVLGRILVLPIGMAAIAALLGFKSLAPNFMLGFDGSAFDQFTIIGMFWSAFLAGMVYLMLVARTLGSARPSRLWSARERA